MTLARFELHYYLPINLVVLLVLSTKRRQKARHGWCHDRDEQNQKTHDENSQEIGCKKWLVWVQK